MKTIEERYSLCSHCLASTTRYCHSDCHHYSKYLGATEQKAIDDKECETMVGAAVKEAWEVFIDKACRWLTEHSYNSDKKQGITCTYVMTTTGTLSTAFRKAMEVEGKAMEIEGISGNNKGIPSNLTWQDVARIVSIADEVLDGTQGHWAEVGAESYFTEVLTRFNNEKK